MYARAESSTADAIILCRFEDLMRMPASAVVRLLSNFTGLYADDDVISHVRRRGKCEARAARKVLDDIP